PKPYSKTEARKEFVMMRKLSAAGLAMIGLVAFLQLASAQAPSPAAAPPAPPSCGDCCAEKVCRPTVEKKTVFKRVYDDSGEDRCLPKCSRHSLLGHLFGGGCGDDCDQGCGGCEGSCGKVRTRKYLVVKQCKHDECVTKCVVEQVPHAPCAAPCP